MNFISIKSINMFLQVLGIKRINWMSKLESAFFLLLKDVWANHELLGSSLYRRELLTTDAWGLAESCVWINVYIVVIILLLFIIYGINCFMQLIHQIIIVYGVLMWLLPHTLAYINSRQLLALNNVSPCVCRGCLCDWMGLSWWFLLDLMLVQSLLWNYVWFIWFNLLLLFYLKPWYLFLIRVVSYLRQVKWRDLFSRFNFCCLRRNLKEFVRENGLVVLIYLFWYFVLNSD